ncbi:MAG: NADH:flavin oxidoreductase/NADH oxidase [Acidimicrobiales bacterium]
MSLLFSPMTLRDLTVPNRAWVSPMCQYSSVDGMPTDWHLVHLGSRAVGGAGLVFTEATSVSSQGRISPADAGLWSDEQAKAYERITAFITEQGAVPGIQLAHAGRKASISPPWTGGAPVADSDGGWEPEGASALPFPTYRTPRAMTPVEITRVVEEFAVATQRALRAGFRAVEIHAAHGYLLHNFFSPLSNTRTDNYGGSFDNRVRLTLEVVDAVRSEWPDELPVMVRISATDWADDRGGWTLEDAIELARQLGAHGVDLVDCSTGGNDPDVTIPIGPGYQVPFAEAVRHKAGVPTGAVGIITEPQQAEDILASGQADVVLMAREQLRNPYWPRQAAWELGDDTPWPVQYERAKFRPVR